jgi:hypothetical protein
MPRSTPEITFSGRNKVASGIKRLGNCDSMPGCHGPNSVSNALHDVISSLDFIPSFHSPAKLLERTPRVAEDFNESGEDSVDYSGHH